MPAKKATKARRKTPVYKRADTLFSKIIRHNASCRICGTWENIQCAHGFSRSYRAIRWDKDNAWPLCRGCHVYYTHHPLEWDAWLCGEWGDKKYWEMRHRALNEPNPEPELVLAVLQKEWKELTA